MSTATVTEVEIQAPDSDFTQIRIDEFLTGKTALFDVHLKLDKDRYLQVFRTGEAYNEEVMSQYRDERAMKYLFICTKDRPKYVAYSFMLLRRMAELANVPMRTKFAIARNLVEQAMQEIFAKGPEEARLSEIKAICEAVYLMIEKDPNAKDYFLNYEHYDSNIYCHGFMTGLFACMLSKRFDWASKQVSESLMMAGMLADIGLSKLPPEIVRKKPAKMKAEEKTQYYTHPTLSAEILSSSKLVPQQVRLIVSQHEELCDGSGFPNKLSSDRILVVAKVFILASELARYSVDYLMTPKDAVNSMFPDRSKNAFVNPSPIFAKFDRAVLEMFFAYFDNIPKTKVGA